MEGGDTGLIRTGGRCPPVPEAGVEHRNTVGRSSGCAELAIPVAQLTNRSITVTIHPPVFAVGADCSEDMNPLSLCPSGCCELTYRIDDVTGSPRQSTTVGDGTAAGFIVNGQPASKAARWIAPATRYAPDQGEGNVTIARILGDLARLKR